jgi:hypothetical protein
VHGIGSQIPQDVHVASELAKLTLRELRAIVPTIPGRIASDFEDQIDEAMEEEAARIVEEVREQKNCGGR